ncbi:WAS/WASL-interacting protein family member 2-like [Penaeus monodon]|uniref:WAS/WASL-interacting protein family member 2-like n=1 Tax=Penaeus monodon TaxID=6687 RepID=UPI0018A7B38B|nr:WAS/WASL-interacting protein family member 2-like [Penaeus monodon]
MIIFLTTRGTSNSLRPRKSAHPQAPLNLLCHQPNPLPSQSGKSSISLFPNPGPSTFPWTPRRKGPPIFATVRFKRGLKPGFPLSASSFSRHSSLLIDFAPRVSPSLPPPAPALSHKRGPELRRNDLYPGPGSVWPPPPPYPHLPAHFSNSCHQQVTAAPDAADPRAPPPPWRP